MKPLIKVMLILAVIFASTFILGRVLGILTVDNVRSWLETAQNVDPIWVITTVIVLLFLDLFVAVPTLTITILAGFFLGFPLGFTAAFVGMASAAFSGYAISSRWGGKGHRVSCQRSQRTGKPCRSFYEKRTCNDYVVTGATYFARSYGLHGWGNAHGYC